MELKDYQSRVLADLSHFLDTLEATPDLGAAFKQHWADKGVRVGHVGSGASSAGNGGNGGKRRGARSSSLCIAPLCMASGSWGLEEELGSWGNPA